MTPNDVASWVVVSFASLFLIAAAVVAVIMVYKMTQALGPLKTLKPPVLPEKKAKPVHCVNCRFWTPIGGYDRVSSASAECRLRAPTWESHHHYGSWPITDSSHFCGEGKALDEVPTREEV